MKLWSWKWTQYYCCHQGGGRTSRAEMTFYVPRHPWGCTGCVWKPHTWWISVPSFQLTSCFNIHIIYFWRKMISLPRLINTTLEWRGSNCFGHHSFMCFKTKQTKQAVHWGLYSGLCLGSSCLDEAAHIRLQTHICSPAILLAPHLDLSRTYIYFRKYGIWRRGTRPVWWRN